MQLWAIGFWALVQGGEGGYDYDLLGKEGGYSPRGYCKRSWECKRMSIKEIVFYIIMFLVSTYFILFFF